MSTTSHCPQCGTILPEGLLLGLCPRCVAQQAQAILGGRNSTPAPSTPNLQPSTKLRYFGDYELLEEIARGGMGVVWKARQVSLNRIVAVKLLLAGKFSGTEFVQRFRTEAEAAANLQHSNIVAIHEVGEHEGQHYFSMDFVDGPNLAQSARDQPWPAKRAAACLKIVAEAVHFAHQRGVIHRDLKPSNVLLDAASQPRVTDFGLAKRLSNAEPETSNSELTVTGQVLGTPAYMPPEQAGGRKGAMGVASDVYSLGALLYFLLTGRAPFVADSLEETLRQVHELEPVSPRLLNPAVPRDLETLCLKCLSKEPRKRYASAQELAEELGRFISGETIHARPISFAEKLWRWCRRKPALAAAFGLTLLLLLTMAIGASVFSVRISRAKDEVTKAHSETTEKLRDSYLAQARANRFSGQPGRRFDSLDALAKAAAIRPASEMRDEAIACLALSDLRIIKRGLTNAEEGTSSVADFALERYATSLAGGGISVRRMSDDMELFQLPATEAKLRHLASFSHNGRLLAVRYEKGSLRVWDLEHRKVMRTGSCADSRELAGLTIDFSPDDGELATVDGTNEVVILDLIHDRPRHLPVLGKACVVRYSPDGAHLAVGSHGPAWVHVLETASGKNLASFMTGDPTATKAIAWHPNGALLAVNDEAFPLINTSRPALEVGYRVTLWDWRRGEAVRVLKGHNEGILSLAFHPDGQFLFSGGWDGLFVWDCQTGERLLRLPVSASSMLVTPDGRRLYRRSLSGAAFSVCELGAGQPVRAMGAGETTGAKSVVFSPDGAMLLTASARNLEVYDANTGQALGRACLGLTEGLAFDGQTNLWTSGARGLFRWPLRHAAAADHWVLGPPEPVGPDEARRRLAVSHDGRTLAVVDDFRGHVLDPVTGQELSVTQPENAHLRYAALSPDGQWLATGTWTGVGASIWNARTGDLHRRVRESSFHLASFVNFSADGRWLFIVGREEFSAWHTGSWELAWQTSKKDQLLAMAIAPDNSLLAVRYDKNVLHLLAPESGRKLATLESPHGEHLIDLSFSPDGARLAMMGHASSRAFVWELRGVRESLASMGLDWDRPPLAGRRGDALPRRLHLTVLEDSTERIEQLHAAVAGRIPPRDPRAATSQIDLTGHYNLTLTNSSLASGRQRENSLSEVPQGLVRLAGIDFDVRGVIRLSGGSPLLRKYPRRVGNVPAGCICRQIHFLHATAGSEPEGTRIGSFVMHFANGQIREMPIVYGGNVRDFWVWSKEAPAPPGLIQAWTGHNAEASAKGTTVRLFKATWKNPLPEMPIESIDFESDLTNCEPFLLAITAEP